MTYQYQYNLISEGQPGAYLLDVIKAKMLEGHWIPVILPLSFFELRKN